MQERTLIVGVSDGLRLRALLSTSCLVSLRIILQVVGIVQEIETVEI